MELFRFSATQLLKLLKDKKIKAVEVIDEVFKNINDIDSELGAFVFTNKANAVKEAKLVDKKIANDEPIRAMEAIPVALKDLFLTTDEPCSAGSKILGNYNGVYDSTVAKNLKDKGAIIVGKTNMDEFAMGSSTENSSVKLTRNPWDLSRVPGGSSGGSAAAVAAGIVPIALGTDTGGSIRQPASFCGVVGLKPTYGRVSRYGVVAFASSLDHVGPITRTVEDAALVMNVIAGYDGLDATCSTNTVPNYTNALNGNVKGIKIGVLKDSFIDGADEDIKKSYFNTIELYKSMGAEFVEVDVPYIDYAIETYYVLAPAEAASNLARYDGIKYGFSAIEPNITLEELYVKTRSLGFGDEVKRRILIGNYVLSVGHYDSYYKRAAQVRRIIKNGFEQCFEKVDAILTPTSPTTAFKFGERTDDPIKMYLSDIFTVASNLAGVPSISLPVGLDKDRLPIGMQLIANDFEEAHLLNIAYALEKSIGEFLFPVVAAKKIENESQKLELRNLF